MEKINIAELLEDCPKGMELDSTMFDNLVFCEIDSQATDYPIVAQLPNGVQKWFASDGRYELNPNAKCVIFPKGKTTWEGFVPPCEFKDGDVIYVRTNLFKWVSIFKKEYENGINTYADCNLATKRLYGPNDNSKVLCNHCVIHEKRLATEEEKKEFFELLDREGYIWDEKFRMLVALPKFKVGDSIRHLIHNTPIYTVTSITDTHYTVKSDGKYVYEYMIPIDTQCNFEKVCLKFNYDTLVPFESKVLVRNDKKEKWMPSFWGYKDDDGYITTFGWCRYCIPYEGNEHLLGKTDDIDEHKKI